MEGEENIPAQASDESQTSDDGQSRDNVGPLSDEPKKAAAPKEPAKDPAKPTERYEIKVNGKVKSVTRDELVRLAQLSESASERFESAAQKERKASAIIERARKNPMEALMDPELGLTKEQIRTAMEDWYTREYIDPETLTPEQREHKSIKERLARFEAQEEEQRAKAKAEAEEKEAAAHLEHFQSQIIDAMETHKLPKTKTNVKRIAFYMRQNLVNGFEAPMELIIQQVKKERAQEDEELKDYSYDQFVERFGEERINFLISENLKRIRERRTQNGGQSFTAKEADSPSGEKISMREVEQRLRAMRMGK